MFIYALFSLAEKLQGRDDWKERLQRLTWDDFLSRDNELWHFCLREGNKLVNSSKVQKTITEKILEKVLS